MPAMREMRVVLPEPEYPTMATNSPRSISRLMSRRTSVRFGAMPKPLLTLSSFRKAIGLKGRSAEAFFGQAHQTIQRETNNPDRQDAKNDVLVDQRIIFLPQE